ncbi:MAG: hypothetical protein WC516_09755 [Patescibacteria group bacterium]|jgi:hypothetical protein
MKKEVDFKKLVLGSAGKKRVKSGWWAVHRDPNHVNKGATISGYQAWAHRSTKAEALEEANRLKKDKTLSVRTKRITRAKNHPWPYGVFYRPKIGWYEDSMQKERARKLRERKLRK